MSWSDDRYASLVRERDAYLLRRFQARQGQAAPLSQADVAREKRIALALWYLLTRRTERR